MSRERDEARRMHDRSVPSEAGAAPPPATASNDPSAVTLNPPPPIAQAPPGAAAIRERMRALGGFRPGALWTMDRSMARAAELIGLCAVFGLAIGVRIARLGTVPRIITGDETDNLQNAYHIIAGTGPGIFGFDWKPAPIFSMYPLAWSIRLFGDSVADFRMFPVVLSLLTLLLFYAVARDAMRPLAALAAMLMLATNLWFLHFSRTAWENVNAALFALGAIYTVTRALRTGSLRWWAANGVFMAFGLYGYFTGRFIFVAVGLTVAIAVVTRIAPWRPALRGFAVACVVAAVLFAPMAKHIYRDWDHFNRRTAGVSVFDVKGTYEGDSNGWVIARKNLVRNTEGLILQDGSEFTRGLWARYNPDHRAPLEAWVAVLLWIGLVAGAIRWRKTYAWWPMFVPLFIAEVFSTGTPDLARAVIIAPILFLFIGLLFDELLARSRPWPWYLASVGVIAVISGYAGVTNVRDYFDWQTTTGVQNARLPGVDVCEFPTWRALALKAADGGAGNLNPDEFAVQRKSLNCSPIVAAWLAEAQGAAAPVASTPAERDKQRKDDLEALRKAANVQSLCVYKEDVGCKLQKVLDPLPRDPQGNGYWYVSDGQTFTLYAQLESGDGGCAEPLPTSFFKEPKAIYCVTGARP